MPDSAAAFDKHRDFADLTDLKANDWLREGVWQKGLF